MYNNNLLLSNDDMVCMKRRDMISARWNVSINVDEKTFTVLLHHHSICFSLFHLLLLAGSSFQAQAGKKVRYCIHFCGWDVCMFSRSRSTEQVLLLHDTSPFRTILPYYFVVEVPPHCTWSQFTLTHFIHILTVSPIEDEENNRQWTPHNLLAAALVWRGCIVLHTIWYHLVGEH